mgnify:CR=1 FL=1
MKFKRGVENEILFQAQSLKENVEKYYIFFDDENDRKEQILTEIMSQTGLKSEEIAYMGDDLNDINIIKKVGLSAAPADAISEVLEIVDFISEKKGGNGAVREFIEFVLKKENLYEKFLKVCLI